MAKFAALSGARTGSGRIAGYVPVVANSADRLRNVLVDQLLAAGMVRTPAVEAAMRSVPRHVFLPGVSLRRAYANDVTATKHDADGVPISAASQPSIVSTMLDQLAVEPGMRILEIGAGTGYNAALLARLTGPGGEVVTVDVDEDITAGAAASLAAAGAGNVTVVRGDGALGCARLAPYDRVIATVGVWDLPLAWRDQLTPGGRIVVPLRLRGAVTRSIAFERPPGDGDGRTLCGASGEMCGFMPLRESIASDPRRLLPLRPEGDVALELQQDQDADPAALASVLGTGRHVAWTGVRFADEATVTAWLYLWLTCAVPGGLCGLVARQSAVDDGTVPPRSRPGTMAAVAGDSVAYLTSRPGAASGRAGDRREIGVIGHGPGGRRLADEIAEQVRIWHRHYRTRTATFTIRELESPGHPVSPGPSESPGPLRPPETAPPSASASRDGPRDFTFRTPHNRLTISWR
jgi:protein-L-isoaspartate(D-aspartate) O-methyltransferase